MLFFKVVISMLFLKFNIIDTIKFFKMKKLITLLSVLQTIKCECGNLKPDPDFSSRGEFVFTKATDKVENAIVMKGWEDCSACRIERLHYGIKEPPYNFIKYFKPTNKKFQMDINPDQPSNKKLIVRVVCSTNAWSSRWYDLSILPS